MAEVRPEVPRPAIVFIGFMAAGKTRAAEAAADRLGLAALDVDGLLESELGESIASLFERGEEAEFRQREEALTLKLLESGEGPGVIALGGGAIASEQVREALADHVCVWCDVDQELAWLRAEGSGRPLAVDREEFSRRYAERQPLYESVAQVVLPSNAREAAYAAAPWIAELRDAPPPLREDVRMLWASSKSGGYPVFQGSGLIRSGFPAFDGRRFLVTDKNVGPRYASHLSPDGSLELEPGEAQKTLETAELVWAELVRFRMTRHDMLIALGGGVVGDLAGFCAATYQRGVPLVQVPTTLVGQVDSAYGGKTGVDLPEAKNYIGAYHQPLAVLTDPSTLETLPPEELAAGFVEVVKTALIAGGALWERVRAIERLDPGELGDVIFACARTKLAVVAEDERDSGRRAVLNLGHTVGHAIEADTGYERYRHGEAVGLGLLAALRLSGADELREEVSSLLAAHGLPTALDPGVDVDGLLEAVGRDKKRTREGLGFVLLERPGEPRWGERVEPDRVRAAVEELRE
ncbi:MAG: bifunctional shikimate kinase/3-dehydroquinate synthase [Solirubrobacterales bacterium]